VEHDAQSREENADRTVNLSISRIKDVTWNTKAFDHLVIAPETKELIRALVQNKIDSKESIDFVPGKGTGLIVLLHGYEVCYSGEAHG